MAARKKTDVAPSHLAIDDTFMKPSEWFATQLELGANTLTQLVRQGVITKAKQGQYAVLPTLRAYVKYLENAVPKSAVEAIERPGKQSELAALVGMSAANTSKLFSDGVLSKGQTLHRWLITYCANLRDHAAGRGGDDNMKLAQARTREALAKAEAQELENLRALGKLCSADEAEEALTEWAMETQRIVMGALERASEHIESKFGITLEPGDLEGYGRAALEDSAHRAEQLASALGEGEEASTAD